MFSLHLSGSTWWRFVLFRHNNSALVSARLDLCLSEVSVLHWPFVCMTNRRLNCGLTPLCLLHWLPIPHPCSHLGWWWCNETAHVTTQLSWDPQPRANWRMHVHMQPLINPIPKAVCLQTWTALCTQHNEVYLYCTVIHDSLGWCWTLSK